MKFKKEGKVLLIIVISAAMAVISMFMTDNSDKLFCSIKRPEPGEESIPGCFGVVKLRSG